MICRRVIPMLALLGTAALIYKEIPSMRRYLKIEKM